MIWSGCIMRNRLVHAYFDINLGILWKTVIEGLPPIIEELKESLSLATNLLTYRSFYQTSFCLGVGNA